MRAYLNKRICFLILTGAVLNITSLYGRDKYWPMEDEPLSIVAEDDFLLYARYPMSLLIEPRIAYILTWNSPLLAVGMKYLTMIRIM